MSYKWKPSASQRQAFAEKMKNPDEQQAYQDRKQDKADKRRSGSQFDYSSAGGSYVPTQAQYTFCMDNMDLALTDEQENAFNQVISAYICQDRVHHDQIHIVNELIRKINKY